MVLEFMIDKTGETNASGFSVGSEEYSKPGFKILTSSTLLIVVESGNRDAFVPSVEAMLTNDGKLSYPTPPKLIFTLLIDPFALGDLVEYLSKLVSLEVYESFSGTCFSEILKVVYDAPTTDGTLNTLYFPL